MARPNHCCDFVLLPRKAQTFYRDQSSQGQVAMYNSGVVNKGNSLLLDEMRKAGNDAQQFWYYPIEGCIRFKEKKQKKKKTFSYPNFVLLP
jgi:hypothetical protein